MRAALLLAALAAPSFAAFEETGAGARAPGLGDAFTAVADDVYALHYNPAGLALLRRPELGTSYSRLFLGLTDGSQLGASFLGYAQPLRGGRHGTLGASWEQFALDRSLYQEHVFTAAYGRTLLKDWKGGELLGGLSLKYLRRSFGSFPEAANALVGNGLQVGPGEADPVLSGRRSAGALDADAGLLFRLPRHYAFGLFLGHLPQPNVAFDRRDRDRLPLTTRLALSYRSLLSLLTAQLETKRSPAGSQDTLVTLAAERWFPRLFAGDFALRGGLGAGSRDRRQLSAGVGYRTRRLGVDYGFALALGGPSSAGAHRVSVSMRFGPAGEAEESVELILEAMRKLKAGSVPELRAAGPGLSESQRVLLEEHVAHARSLQAQARYRAAADRLSQALALSPDDAQVLKAYGRTNFVAQHVPELTEVKTDPVQAALHQGAVAYLAERDAEAVERVSYALRLKPDQPGLDAFLSRLELHTGLKRSAPPGPPPDLEAETTLTRAASALEDGRYQEALDLCLGLLRKDDGRVAAWENVGTAYFALADYPRSLHAWQRAFALEKDPARRAAQRGYVHALQRLMARPKPAARPEPKRVDTAEVQRLYQESVSLYTSGRLREAGETLRRALALDPGHVPSRNALRRVTEELEAAR